MATRLCSNWEAFQHLNPELSIFQQKQTDLAKELLGFCSNFGTSIPNQFEPFLEPDDLLFTETNNQAQFYYSGSETEISHPLNPFWQENSYPQPPENVLAQEGNCYYSEPSQKRFRNSSNCYPQDYFFNSLDGSFGTQFLTPDYSPEFVYPSLEYLNPAGFSQNSEKSTGISLSAQSVAARQRRKKISEKTQELGKLIPGGNKMNTAEMLQAAFNYVKFLQAQAGILGLMEKISSKQEITDSLNSQEVLQSLLNSPTIQEKLYEEQKCMVPTELVKSLSENRELHSNIAISKDLNRLCQLLGV